MPKEEPETFYPATAADWRKWLEENHDQKESVWLLFYKKQADSARVTWSEAVDEALCFGWIDSTSKSLDKDRYIQFFSRRKPKATWSKINKTKIEQLIAEGRMTPAGLAVIERAKENGSWTLLDDVEELVVPKDLEQAFKKHKAAKAHYEGLSKSAKKMVLHRLVMAKRAETRALRIQEFLESVK